VTDGAHKSDPAQASDGSVAPAPVELPELYFRARCAAPKCKALLGGFHIPHVGGMVVFSCPTCGLTTIFKNAEFGIQTRLAGPLVGAKPCPPTRAPRALAGAPRARGQRGGRNR
jgi:predicted RNA-binding Zn-ribbon protein involved in translation (DUF1610 family)